MAKPVGPDSSQATVTQLATTPWQYWVAGVLVPLTLAIVFFKSHELLSSYDERVGSALRGGAMAAIATLLGAFPVLFIQQFSQRTFDTMLGFGAGVMLAASAFSLIIPGLAAAEAQGFGPWMAGMIVGTGILLGAAALLAVDRLMPHEHFVKGPEGRQARNVQWN